MLNTDDNSANFFVCALPVRKILGGRMPFRTLLTTLLQIFCENILNSQVIVKSMLNPDNNSALIG